MPRDFSSEIRAQIEHIFRKHGYSHFNRATIREVRITDKQFGESLAVHPTSGGMTLWVRRDGRDRLRAMAAELGGDLVP